MAPHETQYQHYIPRFILKQFAHAEVIKTRSIIEGHLHVFDLPSGQFSLKEVGKTCGGQNLYYNANDTNPMRIEHLFSKLESRASTVFRKISTAVAEGRDHIDILEKDVHLLFKFMHLSLKRSQQFRDDIENPYRENDFMFQQMFENSRKHGRSGSPAQFWLENLLYLLETSHEDLLADAEQTDVTSSAGTYKHFTEHYALQIWRAADSHEFFLNERLVDFEGDTTSYIGVEETVVGLQLIRMTTDDMIHLVLPITPEVAVIFCDESRCWESQFADAMQRAKIPYPANSLLKGAPHKDIINVNIPSQRRGKKTWPATVAWRVSIGILSRQHHRIISSYSLGHARSFIVVRHRARFERARRELADFQHERAETWKRQGIRFGPPEDRPWHQTDQGAGLSQERMARIADSYASAVHDITNLVATNRERIPISKENSIKCWQAVSTLELTFGAGLTHSSKSNGKSSRRRIMHPALKMAFEAAYPPKHPDHRDLIEVDFAEFVYSCIGEESFVKLSNAIHMKVQELVHKDSFGAYFDAAVQQMESNGEPHPADAPLPQQADFSREKVEDVLKNPCFQSIVTTAEEFDALRWMFEERQDILATFMRQMAVKMEELQPSVIRIRARRE
ncbi:hypothetical protein VTI28DRAFT_7802 [Corynascus sepedonium]